MPFIGFSGFSIPVFFVISPFSMASLAKADQLKRLLVEKILVAEVMHFLSVSLVAILADIRVSEKDCLPLLLPLP